jgi:putative ABC transport system permease protein
MFKPEPQIKAETSKPRKFESIKGSVLLYFAMKNFLDRKLRSFLTVLAVVIGVFAIFFLLSFGLGVQDLVTQQVIGNESLKTIDVSSANSKIIKLDAQAIKQIKTYPHVKQVGVEYSYPGDITYNGGESDMVVYGIDQQYQSIHQARLLSGRLLEAADNKSVVINQAALRAIGIKDAAGAIGKTLNVSAPLNQTIASAEPITGAFSIVGVVESMTGAGGEIFIPSSIFDVSGVPVYSRAKVVIDEIGNVASIRDRIKGSGFMTTSLVDTLNQINDIFKYFNLVLVGFGSIGMVVAILGMFNSLTISLFERTREIGLMIVLGARRSSMRRLFIYEAMIISFTGAAIGVILAIIAGRIVNFYVNLGAASRGVTSSFELFATPLWAIAAIILGTMLIGMAVVYWPARRAERVNPIDALRRE